MAALIDAPNMEDEAAVRQWVEANPGRVDEMLEDRSFSQIRNVRFYSLPSII